MAQEGTEKKVKTKFWLYCRNLGPQGSFTSLGSANPLASTAFKHWAVVTEEEGDDPYIFEAFNVNGLLEASHAYLGKKVRQQWENDGGFFKKDLEEMPFCRAQGISFCKDVNERKEKYAAFEDNCQKFVNEFMSNFNIESVLPSMAATQKTILGSITSASLNSITNFSSGTVVKDMIIKRVGNGSLDKVLKDFLTEASAQGIGKISLLADSPMKEAIAETGRDIVLTAAGEVTENMINAWSGAFNPWQIIQVVVEPITKSFLQEWGFDKTQSYGGSKVASLLVSGGVGLLAGGPVGIASSLAFWLAAEIVAYLIRKLFEYAFGSTFKDLFGESQTELLAKRIFNWFKCKLDSGMLSGIDWMIEYMNDTQGYKKLT